MSRPRRSTAEAFYDVFADFPLEDQVAALKIMEQIHRLAKREQSKPRQIDVTMATDKQRRLIDDPVEAEQLNRERKRSINETHG